MEFNPLHPIFHRLPYLNMITVIWVGTVRKFIRSNYELLPCKLLLEFNKFIVADWGTYAFAQALHRVTVDLRKGMINLKFLRCQQLYFPVTLVGLLYGTIFIKEVEFLATEYGL